MLKNKIDELIESLAFTLAMSEDEIRMLRAEIKDIVREAVGEMVGEKTLGDCECSEHLYIREGYDQRINEEKAKAEEILNQLK